MAKSITIYGASDDLVEVEGAISEEFGAFSSNDEATFYLAVSDGSAFRVKYDGCWRFTRIAEGTATMTKLEADETDKSGSRPDGKPWYSDVMTLTGDRLEWVAFGKDIATNKPLRAAR